MNSLKDRHWPRLPSPLPKDVTDRVLMGYPEHYREYPLVEQVGMAIRALLDTPVEQLLAQLQSADTPLYQRIGAGEVLGLRGDPRIDVFNPQMIDIPGATVQIGLAPERVGEVLDAFDGLGLDRSWIEKETPLHSVQLDRYRIARFAVTNSEYRAFLLDTGHPSLPSSWAFGRYPQQRANHPVYSVSDSDADAYAQWLSQRTGRRFSLPTEAQWEHAAAGPQRLQFPWGEHFHAEYANTIELGYLDSTPVGVFPEGASVFGVLDMAGNVEEYVADDYRPYPGGPQINDDLVLDVGRHRIARGGSFTRFRDLARNPRRHGRYPRPIYVMGFRLVENNN
ncbi:SUMF1/EgtB/PvdO family nonheme iron enzyme [Pseudomonas sp. SBB6]|uniref:formylglycine-generating enzyme family protein n=1 Tax=Pseudomonas sp. SBB6 TaxID=2962032 RepID=UPI0020B7E8AC|nr:SUMF1/EgtB/PvdO family nonheme iron enzyme [Pseudomonas sp. SBB6]MCP3748919.1 formylglycine-generating enzyme family protein [Pseudomonas sp. SBB6]